MLGASFASAMTAFPVLVQPATIARRGGSASGLWLWVVGWFGGLCGGLLRRHIARGHPGPEPGTPAEGGTGRLAGVSPTEICSMPICWGISFDIIWLRN